MKAILLTANTKNNFAMTSKISQFSIYDSIEMRTIFERKYNL